MKYHWGPLVSQKIKNPCAMQETQVKSLGQKVSLHKEIAIYSIFLAWRSPCRGAWWATVHGVANSWT